MYPKIWVVNSNIFIGMVTHIFIENILAQNSQEVKSMNNPVGNVTTQEREMQSVSEDCTDVSIYWKLEIYSNFKERDMLEKQFLGVFWNVRFDLERLDLIWLLIMILKYVFYIKKNNYKFSLCLKYAIDLCIRKVIFKNKYNSKNVEHCRFLTKRQLKATVHQKGMSSGVLGPDNLAISHNQLSFQWQPLPRSFLQNK